MSRILFLPIIWFFIMYASFPRAVNAVNYAECDLCGYCQSKGAVSAPIPENWESCRKCLYPQTQNANNLGANNTLIIRKNSRGEYTGPTPYPGNYFTVLGCVKTPFGSFTNPRAGGSVIQTLLNVVFSIASGVSLLYIFHGSLVILMSRGNAERLHYGKRVLSAAVIGLIFTLSSVFIINLIAGKILQIPGF